MNDQMRSGVRQHELVPGVDTGSIFVATCNVVKSELRGNLGLRG
jgi:hypothetical protein